MSEHNLGNEYLNEDDEIHSHNFDGITELNNKAPLWIIIVFLVTIGFSGIYAIKYFGHPDNEMDQSSEYNKEMAAVEAEKKAAQNQNSVNELSLEEMVQSGKQLFTEKGCIACHGTNGEGNTIGPNLADNFWLHGCSDAEVNHIIMEGVPEKGMTPYKSMLSESQIKNVTAYILHTLVDSNPSNAKAPQGENCE